MTQLMTTTWIFTNILLSSICILKMVFFVCVHVFVCFYIRLVRWVRPRSLWLRQLTSYQPFIPAFSTASSHRMTPLKEVTAHAPFTCGVKLTVWLYMSLQIGSLKGLHTHTQKFKLTHRFVTHMWNCAYIRCILAHAAIQLSNRPGNLDSYKTVHTKCTSSTLLYFHTHS